MTDPTIAELVKRLREAAEGRRYGVTSDLFNEAADRLEALSAPPSEVEAMKAAVTAMAPHVFLGRVDLAARDGIAAYLAVLPRRDEGERMREALETIQTVADNERMDATDAHYAVILAGIQQTARAALTPEPR